MSNEKISAEFIKKKNSEITKDSIISESLDLMYSNIKRFESKKGIHYKDNSVKIISEHTSGTIDFETLNTVLVGLQGISTAAFKDKMSDMIEGSIPNNLLQKSELILTGVSPGSFIISFDSIENKKIDKQLSTHDLDISEEISNIMTIVSKIDSNDKAKELVERYGKETYKKTTGWFKKMEKENISFEFFDNCKSEKVEFDKDNIKEINKSLKEIRKEVLTTEEKLTGTLIGFDVKKGNITLECANEELIKIKINDDSIENVNMETNREYTFNVIVETKITVAETTKEVKKYTIQTLK